MLKESDIPDIRAWRAEGYSDTDIADLFDVAPETIRKARLGITWRHLRNGPADS